MTAATVQAPAYRPFPVRVARVQRLSRSFLRVTFAGDELDEFASNGSDQRIKVALPLPGRGVRDCPGGPDWHGAWRALPADRRNPLRSYTVRATRPVDREVDVDFVLHGSTGPAGAWAARARPGDELMIVGPNARHPGPTGGYEWRPPAGASDLLLAGDETAAPAVSAILEQLPAGSRAHALLEVPTHSDVLDVAVPAGVRLTWLPRRSTGAERPRGELLSGAVLDAVRSSGPTSSPYLEAEPLSADDVLWDVPAGDTGPSGPASYTWLAGEAGVVTLLRRRLLQDVGLDRSSVAFMGYWRQGRAQGS